MGAGDGLSLQLADKKPEMQEAKLKDKRQV